MFCLVEWKLYQEGHIILLGIFVLDMSMSISHNEELLLPHAKAKSVRRHWESLNMIFIMGKIKIMIENLLIISHGNYISMLQVKWHILLVRRVDGIYKLERIGRMLL